MVKTIKNVMLYIWQLLQNIIGLGFLLTLKNKVLIRKEGNVRIYSSTSMSGGVTLGDYIIFSTRFDETDIQHELGHTIQSRILGPLYLFVIGIPSIIHAWIFDLIRDKKGLTGEARIEYNKTYYDFYTERWADKLGGVVR